MTIVAGCGVDRFLNLYGICSIDDDFEAVCSSLRATYATAVPSPVPSPSQPTESGNAADRESASATVVYGRSTTTSRAQQQSEQRNESSLPQHPILEQPTPAAPTAHGSRAIPEAAAEKSSPLSRGMEVMFPRLSKQVLRCRKEKEAIPWRVDADTDEKAKTPTRTSQTRANGLEFVLASISGCECKRAVHILAILLDKPGMTDTFQLLCDRMVYWTLAWPHCTWSTSSVLVVYCFLG